MPSLEFQHVAWVVGPLLLAAVLLAFAHLQRTIVARLGRLAARRGGRLIAQPWYVAPRVEWTTGGLRLTVSTRSEGEESRHQGSRTFAHATVAGPREFELELLRAERSADGFDPAGTRDADFERAFRVSTTDARATRAFLDRDLRRALLAFEPSDDVALRLGASHVYRDGLWRRHERERRLEVSIQGMTARTEVLEDLLALARLAHERLERLGARRAA